MHHFEANPKAALELEYKERTLTRGAAEPKNDHEPQRPTHLELAKSPEPQPLMVRDKLLIRSLGQREHVWVPR